jgi:small-conductance mechanosensitive channel
VTEPRIGVVRDVPSNGGSRACGDAKTPSAPQVSIVGPSSTQEVTTRAALRTARHRLTVAAICGAGAVAVLATSSDLGNVHAHSLREKLVAFIGAVVFLALSAIAIRACGVGLATLVATAGGVSSAGAVRIVVSITGYTIVVFACLGLLGVPVQKLLVGGAVAGVILGIAAQQTLGNVFAGIVLIMARPFTLGEFVRVRAGSLGGIFEGQVTAMNLVYVTILTDEGAVNVPNATLLAVGVGPAPPKSAPTVTDVAGPTADS